MDANGDRRCFQAMIGVGGIGWGRFFALQGNHTLGREESRAGRFLDRRDYCKLHIVSHYVKALLGPEFPVIAIGMVGDDEAGGRLLREMRDAGLDVRYVTRVPGHPTLFSFCFCYPDGGGGNLTTKDSACACVDPASVAQAKADFVRFRGRGVVVALPEVGLAARQRLLELGTEHRFFRAASLTTEEARSPVATGILCHTDLLAVNLDEAAALAGISADRPPAAIVEAAVVRIGRVRPGVTVSITVTAGKAGSWSWDGERLVHVPAFPAEAASTAGAGDAHLAGTLAGLAAGLALSQAHEIGALTAGLSVTSPHTIHRGIDRRSLRAYAAAAEALLSDAVADWLGEDNRGIMCEG